MSEHPKCEKGPCPKHPVLPRGNPLKKFCYRRAGHETREDIKKPHLCAHRQGRRKCFFKPEVTT